MYVCNVKSKDKNKTINASGNASLNIMNTNLVFSPPALKNMWENVNTAALSQHYCLCLFVLSRAEKLRMRTRFCAPRLVGSFLMGGATT